MCNRNQVTGPALLNVLLAAATINHCVLIGFICFIDDLMASSASELAGGYGMVYGLVVFPFQVVIEGAIVIAIFYQLVTGHVTSSRLSLWLVCAISFIAVLFMS